MKSLYLLFILLPLVTFGQTNMSGNISGNSTWSISDSPINIVGDVGVPGGSVLTIEHGVTVNFTGDYQILVLGSVTISGVEGDSVTFNGNNVGGSGTKKMLEVQNTDLSLSRIDFVRFQGPQDVLLVSRETEHDQDFPKNYGTLDFANCRFIQSTIQTDGFESQGKLKISDSRFESMLIKGRYPSSEPIEIFDSQITNSIIYADSYNKGITLTNTFIDNSEFRIGCCNGVHITIISSRIENCNFISENDYHNININNSILINAQFNRNYSNWYQNQNVSITGSIVYNNSFHTIRYQNINIVNSLILGDGGGIAVDAGFAGNNAVSLSNSTISGFAKSIVLDGTGETSGSNFNGSDIYIELISEDNFQAAQNFWSLDGESLSDKIIDSQDNLSLGAVSTEPILESFSSLAPSFPSGDLSALVANKQLFTSRVENLPGCLSDMVEISVQADIGFQNNYFILQMSDVNHSFNKPVNLDTLQDGESTLASYIPDTIKFGSSYLLRVYSTQNNQFTFPVEIIINDTPTPSFESDPFVCSGEAANISYTGSASGNATYAWDFDGGTVVSGSNQGPYEVVWDSSGDKNITLTVSENGCSGTSQSVVQVLKTPSADFSTQSFICEEETASVVYNGNGTNAAAYLWDFDGGSVISGEGAGPYEIAWDSFGTKTISLTVTENGCSSEKKIVSIGYNKFPLLSFEAEESDCYNENYQISFTGSGYTDISWNFDGANVVSGTGSGPYLLNWNTSGQKRINFTAFNNGCSVDSTLIVDIPAKSYTPEICMVTVDEKSSKNMLVWSYDLETVNQFGVYRESNVSGEYSLVEYVKGGLSNTYIDNQSSPGQLSNRYKITSLDSCGTETELSNYHKTIHLTINKGLGTSWNLIWDGYEGFSFGTYRIYRSLDGGVFEILTEIASNLSSYTDSEVKSSDVAYQIEVLNPNNCEQLSNGRIAQSSTSKSNIARTNAVLSINDVQNKLRIYPNPTSQYLQIELNNSQFEHYELLTAIGQIVKSGNYPNGGIIDLQGIAPGIYYLKVFSGGGSLVKKIMKK